MISQTLLFASIAYSISGLSAFGHQMRLPGPQHNFVTIDGYVDDDSTCR